MDSSELANKFAEQLVNSHLVKTTEPVFGVHLGDSYFGFVSTSYHLVPNPPPRDAPKLFKKGCPYCGAPGSHWCYPRGTLG